MRTVARWTGTHCASRSTRVTGAIDTFFFLHDIRLTVGLLYRVASRGNECTTFYLLRDNRSPSRRRSLFPSLGRSSHTNRDRFFAPSTTLRRVTRHSPLPRQETILHLRSINLLGSLASPQRVPEASLSALVSCPAAVSQGEVTRRLARVRIN